MTKSKAPPITIGMVLILFTALSLIFAYSCECPAQTPTPAPTAEPSATPEKTPTPRIITPTPTPEICTRLDEGFDGFETGTRPAGWTFINCDQNADTYTTAGNFGHLSPSIRLDATGDIIETNLFSQGSWLQFWIKGQGTDASSHLLVEEYYGSGWSEVTDLYGLSAAGTMIGDLDLLPSADRLRFSYTRSAGAAAFDDVLVGCLITPTPTATPTPAPVATPIADIYNGFDNFEFGTRKSGWTFSGIGNSDIYLSPYYYGLNRPGLQLADDGDYFTSEALVGVDRELGYWMRGSGTGSDSYLSIDGRVYFDPYYYWSNIQEVKPLPQVETSTSGIEIMDDVLSLRFTYHKTTGELALDDFLYNAITPTVTPTPVGYLTPTPTPVGYHTPTPTITPVPSPSVAPTPSPTPEDQMYSIIVLPFQFKGTLIIAD